MRICSVKLTDSADTTETGQVRPRSAHAAQQVASKENMTNRMKAKLLATLFAPHLLCPKSMKPADLQRYCTILTVQLEFMLKNVWQIFKAPTKLTLNIWKELQRMDKLNLAADGQSGESDQAGYFAELYAHI